MVLPYPAGFYDDEVVVVDFSALKKSIIPLLQQAVAGASGLLQVTVPCAVKEGSEMLNWLASQPLYPQFYWYHRNGTEEVVGCGALETFSDIGQAQTFIRGQGDPQLRIWGLNAFGQIEVEGYASVDSLFFLPRVILMRQGENLTMRVHLYGEMTRKDDLAQALQDLSLLIALKPLPPWQSQIIAYCHQPERKAWETLIARALFAIEQKMFEKVVLARRTMLTLQCPLNAARFLAASRAVNHRCYHFMLVLAPQYAFLGSTPERLYRRCQLSLETEALAGTVARGESERHRQKNASWLMQDGKNQHENLLVVDDICQRLQGGVKMLDVMPAEVLCLRQVQHLRRPIHATLLRADDVDCINRLQPTAAVAGLPRESARQFILQEEPFDRDWYAGSAGYLALGQAEFAVSLRCALVKKQQVYLYAGAGIVAGSDAQQEWQEIENKAAGLRTLLENEKSALTR